MPTEIRHALRLLRRNPGFSAVACVILALGIGANTALFSVVDAALLRPLPYRQPDRLVDLVLIARSVSGQDVEVITPGQYGDDLRKVGEVFESLDAFSAPHPRMLAMGTAASLQVGAFTPTFLGFLGVQPQLGRPFVKGDVPSPSVVLISDAYWRQAFNCDPAVVGTTIAFSDHNYVIVGVMPPTFRFYAGARTDAWVPVAERDAGHLVGRLRPGLTIEQAQRELNAALARPGVRHLRVELLPGDWSRAVGSTPVMLFSLLGAVGLVLLVACANVANLLLSRTITRQREIAVRGALGATRLRLARQVVIEGLLLAGAGGVAAVALAWVVIKAIPAIVPASLVSSLLDVRLPALDLRVLAFGCLTAVLTGVLCSVMPALRASRPAAAEGLLAGALRIAGSSRAQRRVRDAFQAVQVAMTLVLLTGAGLLLASLLRMVSVPVGFDSANLGYADVSFPPGSETARRQAFADGVMSRLAALPAVQAVAFGPPPVSGYTGARFIQERADGLPAVIAPLEYFPVQPDYFRVAGIHLLAGRTFGPEDVRGARPVAIISENAARRFWPRQSALGQRFRRWADDPLLTVVGIVPEVRTTDLARDAVQAYVPAAQWGVPPAFVFRMAGNPAAAMTAVRDEIRAIDPGIPLRGIGLVDTLLDEFDPYGPARFYALLLGTLAGIALLTAAVGLYGVLSYSVSRRVPEIGVRMALGADVARIRNLLVSDVLLPVGVGMAIGLLAAAWLSRLVASQLFRITPHDPLTYTAIALLFLVATSTAAIVPVRRATRVEPAEALRAE